MTGQQKYRIKTNTEGKYYVEAFVKGYWRPITKPLGAGKRGENKAKSFIEKMKED